MVWFYIKKTFILLTFADYIIQLYRPQNKLLPEFIII